ncbi:uncharacterized protein LY89DRAFT_158267 [Mollisia scopiformis]|uniref:Uncharacterized protein n=1 Tax=Mollisia scopiformis TaxID=149040 RepID=A0A194WZQ4_MOLSC|nr:uncharacterized protein LY89DRAFT_158267 [Mollisia scopiformis]KUJ13423.1 hypothetical protein LY89DRAFT_158267 [Mollisia scopiformis]
MAHNTHIPWTLLSTHLKLTPTSRKPSGHTNLYPRYLPTQAGELAHFASIFARTIRTFSSTERSKHPSPTPIPSPSPSSLIISDRTAAKNRENSLPLLPHHIHQPRVPGIRRQDL